MKPSRLLDNFNMIFAGEGKVKDRILRRRRSTGKKYVETTVVVDQTSYNFHGGETEKMVKTIMNIVSLFHITNLYTHCKFILYY